MVAECVGSQNLMGHFHTSSVHKSITFRFLDLMLAVLAIKSGLTHAGRPIKLSKEFVQLEDLYTWI